MVDQENRETDMHENGGAAEGAPVREEPRQEPVTSSEAGTPDAAAGAAGERETLEATAGNPTEHPDEMTPPAEEPAGHGEEVGADLQASEHHPDENQGDGHQRQKDHPADETQTAEAHADEVHALEDTGARMELQDSTEPTADHEHETAADAGERERQLEENLQRKEALITRAEELKESTEWKATADEIKRLQAEWKKIGPVAQERSQELWDRFRAPANHFFEQRQGHLGKLREEQEENLRKKEALCVRAEELASSSQWKSTAEALQALQAEWKTIGPVPREHGDPIWKRFRKSLDEFFGRRQEHYARLRKDQEENLRKKEALCVRAEELSQSTQWKATSEAIKALQGEWKAVGPVPQKKADAIWKRFRGSIDVFFERQAAYFENRNQNRDQRDSDRRDQMLDALERKREQTLRLRESLARDEENVTRWQATLANLRPAPNVDETRTGLEAKVVDVESRMGEKRARLDELEKSILEIAAKLSAPPPKPGAGRGNGGGGNSGNNRRSDRNRNHRNDRNDRGNAGAQATAGSAPDAPAAIEAGAAEQPVEQAAEQQVEQPLEQSIVAETEETEPATAE
jgi:hypothetical protein